MHLCKKIRVVILKIKGRKNEKPKFIARFKKKINKCRKKKEKIQIEKIKKRDSITNHLSTTISFPEPSPSIVGGEKKNGKQFEK